MKKKLFSESNVTVFVPVFVYCIRIWIVLRVYTVYFSSVAWY